MEIIKLNINEVIPYPDNPRKNDNAVDAVAESIKQCGYCSPIVIDEENVILAGHTRLKALKKLKWKEVECVRKTGLTDEQKKKYRILDNKTNELAEWDFDLLEEEIDGLDFDGFDFGFDFNSGEDDAEIIEDEAPEIDEENEPITQYGDIWQLGEHRLMCGDSTDKATVERLMDGKQVDMILSDPPYGMCLDTDFSGAVGSLGRKGGTRGNKYDKIIGDNDDFKPELISTFFDNFGYCKEVFLFGADYFAELLPNKNDGAWLCWDKRKESQADAIGSEFELIWSKNKHKRRMLRHDWFGFLSSQNAKDAQHRVHPTQKPVTLLVDIINQWGNGCNIIVDLYGGSGSTLIACEQLNRKCYCMELDPKYCDVIIKRWETFTGKNAVKIN
jgi:site-specific DNA-methyltransferase (adenine-specific)